MPDPVLSIVLPSYREAENLRLILPRVRVAAASLAVPTEVLVVDTKAPLDDTAQVCAHEGARYLSRGPTDAYADSVRSGIAAARGQWILFMDADGSHEPELIPTLFARRGDADVVIASRYVEGGQTENSRVLVLMSWVVNVCYRVVLGLAVKDVSNSFKLYRGDWLRSLELRCENFDVIEEILYKLRLAYRARMLEIPARFGKRMFGETKRNLVLFMLSYAATLVRLRLSARGELRRGAGGLGPGFD